MAYKRRTSFQAEAWDVLQYLFELKKLNDHTVHFVAAFSGKINVEQLKKAVALSADVFPLIVSRFAITKSRPLWMAGGYTADEIVTCFDTEDAAKGIDDFICTPIDTFAGPQLKIKVIRSGEKDALVVVMNHMLCDGAGFKDYLYLLSDLYSSLQENPDYHPAALGSRRIGQLFKAFSGWEKLKILLSKNYTYNHDSAAFEFAGDLQNPFIERREIPRELFYKLKAYGKERNATVNDLFLSAYIRSLYTMFGRAVSIPCTVDLRKYVPGNKAESICNLCTNLFCDIGPEIGPTFDQTLCKVKQAMDREKASVSCLKSITLMEKLYDILPYKTAKMIVDYFSNAPISFTNVGALDQSRLAIGNAHVAEEFMTGSIKFAHYFLVAVSTFDDLPTLSVNLYGTQSDRKKISLFLENIAQELESAVYSR